MTENKGRFINLKVGATLREKVDGICAETGTSISTVCRLLLSDSIARLEAEAHEKSTRSPTRKTISAALINLAAQAEKRTAQAE